MNKWEDLWHQQKANSLDIDMLTKQLYKLEKIAKFQKLLFLFASVFAIYSMLTRLSLNIYNIISITLIIMAFLMILIPLFGNKINSNNDNTNLFIENQIKYLRKKLLLPKVYLLIFIMLFILALNIAFWGAFNQLENFYRVLLHFSTFLLFVVLFTARNIGVKNYEKEILPLISNLEKIKEEE